MQGAFRQHLAYVSGGPHGHTDAMICEPVLDDCRRPTAGLPKHWRNRLCGARLDPDWRHFGRQRPEDACNALS